MVNYYAKLSKLIDSRDTDETDDSTVHDSVQELKSESGPGKWYTCKYQGDYHVNDDGITSLYTCTEEVDLLTATFLSDKGFSPNQTEHDFFKTSARDEYIHFIQIFFQQSSRLPPKRYCVTKIILEEVPYSHTQLSRHCERSMSLLIFKIPSLDYVIIYGDGNNIIIGISVICKVLKSNEVYVYNNATCMLVHKN